SFFAPPKLIFSPLAFGDVLADADQYRWTPGGIDNPRALAMEHSHGAVRTNNTLVEFERRGLVKRRFDGGPRCASIIGVNTFEIPLECGRELIRGEPEDPAQFLGSIHLVAVYVPLVASEV